MKSGTGFKDGGVAFAGRVKADQSGYFIRMVIHLNDGQEVERYEFDEEGASIEHTVFNERYATQGTELHEILDIFAEKFGKQEIEVALDTFWADSRQAYADFVEQGVIVPHA